MSRLYVLHDRQCEIVDIGLELTIGRDYSNRLRFEGGDVSRAHAIIYRRGDEFVLRDLDSKNGVCVNGHNKLKHILKGGDTVTIGKYVLLFDPPEPVDLSKWLPADQGDEPRRAAQITLVQQQHQHCPLETLENYFESQVKGDVIIDRATAAMRFTYRAITGFGGESDTDEVCQHALDWAIECFAARRGLVALARKGQKRPHTVAMFDAKDRGEILIHRELLKWLADKGEALISIDPGEDASEEEPDKDATHRMGVPLKIGGKVRGFIYLENDPPQAPFTTDDLQQLHCIALATSRRLEEMAQTFPTNQKTNE